MEINNIMVAGSGVLGSQIAFQSAVHGFGVHVYDINEVAIEAAKERFDVLKERYKADLGLTDEVLNEAYNRIVFFTSIEEAVGEVQLVIEAVPELLDIKQKFYEELSEKASDEIIFASNSSTLIPSQIKQFVKKPERYVHLHFANEIWKFNIAEIMKHEGTEEFVFDRTIEFAKEIGMVPIPIYKEQPGYVLNSLLVPFLNSAQYMVVNGVADPHTIDKTWMISTGAPMGPFAILDIVGINTPYNLSKAAAVAGDKEAEKIAAFLKENFIDKNKLGVQSGAGFYTYPNPAYKEADFLK